jgi:hypothetical protein
MLIGINEDVTYNCFLTQRYKLSSSEIRQNPNAYEYGNLPPKGIRSLFTETNQNIQICNSLRTVLAELKIGSYNIYVSNYDKTYEDLLIVIGLIETYRSTIAYLDTISIE